jgi:hypothetical protein
MYSLSAATSIRREFPIFTDRSSPERISSNTFDRPIRNASAASSGRNNTGNNPVPSLTLSPVPFVTCS